MQALLEQVLAIAYEADDAIAAVYARGFSVELKDDNSPVTEADQAAHDVIMRGLKKLSLQLPILSEEDADGFVGINSEGRYWLVDPLDGTKEFIKRNDEFTVNIALIENGKPILGVVTAPVLNVAYIAAEGVGAFKVDASGHRYPLHVAGRPPSSACWRVMGSRSHFSPDLAAWLERLGKYEMQPMGSSLKLCLIAEGKADVYPRLGPTCLWDTGAAHAVLLQAGGRVETLDGQPLCYANPSAKLNPDFVAWGS
ncbi:MULTISPECIES: 3'(2'),5'-bisphosphate nucleotidase CysQ [Vreelandella]|uniref:3'(2'),5'-bisphosphate nucleotidase CysQ n=2 Tax=Vreelandella TaxID=3137766 RepID=A0A7C9NQM5_9GAMM|nr:MULTISPECIES: 3'(2'),5'-bisphosphate nucleotidase CysQ [Halomonas]NDL70367.1 3'(2'),5'-bisphosphate nucleotidase CysQ [Halomonas alkaliphila]NYS43420.1 3'(2'),5'-bisphosphate nucleotidase CysQ [Halomonas zhaodongensis]